MGQFVQQAPEALPGYLVLPTLVAAVAGIGLTILLVIALRRLGRSTAALEEIAQHLEVISGGTGEDRAAERDNFKKEVMKLVHDELEKIYRALYSIGRFLGLVQDEHGGWYRPQPEATPMLHGLELPRDGEITAEMVAEHQNIQQLGILGSVNNPPPLMIPGLLGSNDPQRIAQNSALALVLSHALRTAAQEISGSQVQLTDRHPVLDCTWYTYLRSWLILYYDIALYADINAQFPQNGQYPAP